MRPSPAHAAGLAEGAETVVAGWSPYACTVTTCLPPPPPQPASAPPQRSKTHTRFTPAIPLRGGGWAPVLDDASGAAPYLRQRTCGERDKQMVDSHGIGATVAPLQTDAQPPLGRLLI